MWNDVDRPGKKLGIRVRRKVVTLLLPDSLTTPRRRSEGRGDPPTRKGAIVGLGEEQHRSQEEGKTIFSRPSETMLQTNMG